MNSRREFVSTLGILAAAWPAALSASGTSVPAGSARDERARWLEMLQRVAGPVLESLAANRLRERMPIECAVGQQANRGKVSHLEAVGRTFAGLAPWLELDDADGAEASLRSRWAGLARQGLANISNPDGPDHLDFTAGAQCLVDAAFLAHALLRARRELWEKLEASVQQRLVTALQSTRRFKPGNKNWLLFSAMIEAFLARAGAEWQEGPIERAVRAHEQWYKGDGIYGDGPEFHWDYYNSFVIQPFLVDVLEHIEKVTDRWSDLIAPAERRATRYAAIQERLIAPDGSYPVVGRSIAYRCGAFQLLAQMALRHQLPPGVTPPQVRGALAAVIQRTLGAAGAFDNQGWLRIGLAGAQPALGEGYISTGSLYLCTVAFLPLGLPATDPFWAAPSADWTSRKVWSGQDLSADHALG